MLKSLRASTSIPLIPSSRIFLHKIPNASTACAPFSQARSVWTPRSHTALLLKAGLIALCCGATPARAADLPLWEAGAGVAVINFPDYRGSEQRRTWVLPYPYFVYRGESVRVDDRGMHGLFFKSDRAELDVTVSGSPPVDSTKNNARRGMPDLDPTLEIGPTLNFILWRTQDRLRNLELHLPLRAVIATDFSRVHHEGWVFQPNVEITIKNFAGNQGLKSNLMAGLNFSSRRYNHYYYAVDPAFATTDRPAYAPGHGYAGAQITASLSKRYQNFWVGSFARWENLRGAVFEDSPLVKDHDYFAVGIAISWIIGESKTRVPDRE